MLHFDLFSGRRRRVLWYLPGLVLILSAAHRNWCAAPPLRGLHQHVGFAATGPAPLQTVAAVGAIATSNAEENAGAQ